MTPGAPLLAEALRGTFRAGPVAHASVPEALLRSTEVTGAEALLRRRLLDAPSETERFQSLELLRRERWLAAVFFALEREGIPAATFKGWAVARLYGRPGLRPVGDVDLLVHPRDLARARSVVAGVGGETEVDLQSDLARYLPDRSTDALLSESEVIDFHGGPIRVLAPADHLRLVCLHQLHHGCWRPLWLCDVAVLLETLPLGFSWSACLAGSRNLSDGVLACAHLAREWLGAEPSVALPEFVVPRWFRRGVRRAWTRGYRPTPERLEGIRCSRLARALRQRWPDPFSSTLHLTAPFGRVPRLPIQLLELVRRGSRHAQRRFRARTVQEALAR